MSILRLLQSLDKAVELAQRAQRAAQGSPEDAEYLRREGWADALDVLVRPGAGAAGRRVMEGVQEVLGRDNGVIEGEYRVIEEGPPWQGFLRRLLAMPHGGHIILGPVGSGKTSLALKLGQRYHERHGYRVECVNMYAEDVPGFGVSIGRETLVSRMKRLTRWLNSQVVKDEDDMAADDERGQEQGPGSLPPTGRVIIIDEASLGMTSSAMDPARRSALQALAQCRHLNWIVIYIGQWAGQIPLPLLGQSTVWVKRPDGREAVTDRDNPAVRDLWERATEGFTSIKRSAWYTAEFADYRAWAYCDCRALGNQPGYVGMLPFTPAGTGPESDPSTSPAYPRG